MTFTPAELAAAEESFALHKQGKCPGDCGFCEDLFLSSDPRHHVDLKWIRGLKNARKSRGSHRSKWAPRPQKAQKQRKPALTGHEEPGNYLVPHIKLTKEEKRDANERLYRKKRR